MSKFPRKVGATLKVMYLSLLGFVAFIVALGGVCYVCDRCWQTVTPERSFIKDWPQFGYHTFAMGVTELIPISYNWDTHRMEYDYLTIYEKDELLALIDRRAARHGWSRDHFTFDARTYTKPFRHGNIGTDYYYRVLKVQYLSGKKRVKIVVVNGPCAPPPDNDATPYKKNCCGTDG